MNDDNHSLEELKQKAEFLRKEKQRIIRSQKEKEAIKKLQAEIEELENPKTEGSTKEEFINASKKGLEVGLGALRRAGKDLLNKTKDSAKTPIEKDLQEAQQTGLWPNEEIHENEERIPNPQTGLERKWQEEKIRLIENKNKKIQTDAIANQKAEKIVNEGCLAVLGAFAWFIPFLWPLAIIQLFKTYPKTCFTLLGVFTFLVIVISASSS